MIRSLGFLLIAPLAFGPLAFGQDKSIDALRQAADQTATRWEGLTKGLDEKIAHLLPCDPNSRAAVEEVSRASDSRLVALAAYLKAEAARAKEDTEAAKRVMAAQAALAGGWNTERAEAEQSGSAIEAQVAELKESMRKRGTLAGAEQVLVEIARIVKDRAVKSSDLAGRKEVLIALLGDMVLAYQDRQTALENESAQLQTEGTRWSAYYTARLARSTTECTIINNPNPRKKQP